MPDNTPLSGTVNGEQLKASGEGQRMKEHLKSAGSSAGEALRERAAAAANTARSKAERARARAQQAGGWARERWTGLQGRVDSQPRTSAAVALGIGLVAGVLITTLLRGRD